MVYSSIFSKKTVDKFFWHVLKEFDKLQEACEHFRGPHFDEIKCILLQWCKLVDMPRYEFEQKDIPDVVTLEKLSEMPYQYADEAEREYYTKWKKDLIEKVKR